MKSKVLPASLRELLFKIAPLLTLILLSIFLSIVSDNFLKFDNIMNVLRQASTIALIAVGMLIVIITAGIDLSVGPLMALSICVMGIVMKAGVTSPFLLIVVCLLVGSGMGVLNGLLLTRLNLPHPFISTIGTRNVATGLALIITGAAPILGFPEAIEAPGSGDINGFPISFLIVIIVYVLVHFFLNNTALGREIYSIGGNKEAALLSGINVKNVLTFVYGFSGFMCACAGIIFVGRVGGALPLAGTTADMDAIAAVIIGGASFFGGKGTVWGTMIGVLLISVIRNGLNLLSASSDLQFVVMGIVIIVAVFIDVIRTKIEEKARRMAKAE
ncbi:MAG TPA: ABC transporter permease [Clostridia bacterium]|nr:ABC transporter permease [Clostridia bacterium]